MVASLLANMRCTNLSELMLIWHETVCQKSQNSHEMWRIWPRTPKFWSMTVNIQLIYCSYKGLCLRTFLQVLRSPNCLLILRDFWGRTCLWGSVFNCGPGALAYPELSQPCRPLFSLLHTFLFPLFIRWSDGYFWRSLGVYVPNEYSNPTQPLFPRSPTCLTAHCGLAWSWPHIFFFF